MIKRILNASVLAILLGISTLTATHSTKSNGLASPAKDIIVEIEDEEDDDSSLVVVEEHIIYEVGTSIDNETMKLAHKNTSIVESFDNKGWITTTVNIRKYPNTDCEILGTYKYNKKIKYVDYNDKWVKIKYKNNYAYIAKKYVSNKKMPEINIDMSNSEFELLCRVVMAEGGNTEPDLGIRYMADGILNRVDSSRFPNTIQEVLTAPYQFSCVSSGSIYRWTPTEKVIKICKEEITSRTNTQVIYWRTGHYHSGTTSIAKVGNHYYSGL